MNKRLRIARKLLSERGVIFISIDEHEHANLKLLCDEIFHEQNFVGQWNWFKSATPPALSKKIKRNIEYILCWQKGKNNDKFKGIHKTSKSNDPFTKPQNSLKVLIFPPNSITCKLEDGTYSPGIYGTEKFPNELLNELHVVNGKNFNQVSFKNKFIWLQDTLNENIEDGLYIELSKKLVLSYKRDNYSPEVPPNFIDMSVGVDTTENAGRDLKEIFDGVQVFDYPKPIALIKYIVNFLYFNDFTVLDFFAGSGTTMHAVMALNDEDGGHRQCILVTNNENNICEEVTYERNKRVITGYTKPNGEFVEGLRDNNLRYYRTAFVGRNRSPRNLRQLVNLSTDMLCIKEDLYAEQKEFCGTKTRKGLYRYFDDGNKRMLVIYREEYISELVEMIAEMNFDADGRRIMVYVFSPSEEPWRGDFEPVADRVDLCSLPNAILNVYKRVLPKRKDSVVYVNPDSANNESQSIPNSLFPEMDEEGGEA